MDVNAVMTEALPVQTHRYTAKDSMFYALSVGFSADPLSATDLRYSYEQDLITLPTMVCVLAHPGFWFKDPRYAIDWVRILHGGQTIEMLRPLPPEGEVRAEYKVIAIDDKGAERGAVLTQEKLLYDNLSDELVARIRSTVVLRGDGGCGSFGEKPAPAVAVPDDRQPDVMRDLPTFPSQALFYRLNGDSNPIHADPKVAASAGFPKPILHGLCTMGIACRAVVQAFCDGDSSRLRAMNVRFTNPVFPGETLRLEAFVESERILFRLRVIERDVLAMNACEARVIGG